MTRKGAFAQLIYRKSAKKYHGFLFIIAKATIATKCDKAHGQASQLGPALRLTFFADSGRHTPNPSRFHMNATPIVLLSIILPALLPRHLVKAGAKATAKASATALAAVAALLLNVAFCTAVLADELVISGSGNPELVLRALAEAFGRQQTQHRVSVPPKHRHGGCVA